jgi:hypothetical protein
MQGVAEFVGHRPVVLEVVLLEVDQREAEEGGQVGTGDEGGAFDPGANGRRLIGKDRPQDRWIVGELELTAVPGRELGAIPRW